MAIDDKTKTERGNVIANMSMSLDGFIAGPNAGPQNGLGDGGERLHEWTTELASWREQHGLDGGKTNRASEIVAEANENVEAYVMGRGMFSNEDGPWGDDPFEGHWGDDPPFGVPVFVLTHHPRDPLEMDGGTTYHFVTDGLERALEQAQEAAGDANVRIEGGGNVIQQFIEAGLIDELYIHLVPVLFGDGIRLFDTSDNEHIELEPTEVIDSPDVTHLKYRLAE